MDVVLKRAFFISLTSDLLDESPSLLKSSGKYYNVDSVHIPPAWTALVSHLQGVFSEENGLAKT